MTRMITVVKKEDNFRYTTFETGTKAGIESRMASYGTYSAGGNRRNGTSYYGRVSGNKEFIFLYTAQKFRRKTVHTIKKPGKKDKIQQTQRISTPVRAGHWKVQVFKFPLDRVITAKQESRTFKVTITA